MSRVQRSRGLGGELREVRELKDLSIRAVAKQLGWQPSKLSRMETGKQGIPVEDVASLLAVYGVKGDERHRLITLAERPKEPGWWETYESGLSPWSKSIIEAESEAAAIFNFEPLLIPGLLQVADYARALMKGTGAPDIDTRVAMRMARQAILSRESPPDLCVVLDEPVLRRVLGSPRVMARQLRHLTEAAERPTVTIQVVPMSVGAHAGLDGPFVIFDFARRKGIVVLEHRLNGLFVNDAEQVAIFRKAKESLVSLALTPAKSLDFIARLAHERERE